MEVTIKPSTKPASKNQPQPNPNPPATPTQEELKKMRSDVSESMGWGKVENDPPSGSTAPAATPAPAAPTPSPSAAPASPQSAPVKPEPKPAPAPDHREVIRETATEVGRAVADALATREPAASEPELQLIAEDEEALGLARFLSQSDPTRYGNLPDQLLRYFQELYAYQDKWAADNPGQKFDPEASEHADWYAEHPQPVDLETLERARRDQEIEARVAQRMKPLEEKLTMIDQENLLSQAMPEMVHNLLKHQWALVNAAAPELAKLLLTDGKVDLGKSNLERLEAEDPIAKAILDDAARGLTPLIMELERVAVKGANYKLDPEGNSIHRIIDQARQRAEQEILETPEAQDKGGRKFITLSQMAKRQQAIEASRGTRAHKDSQIAQLKATYWTLTVDELEDLLVDETARSAKAQIDHQDQLAQRKYRKNGAPAPAPERETPQSAPAPAPEPAPQPASRARPVSFSSQSDAHAAPQTIGQGSKSAGEVAAEVHFK